MTEQRSAIAELREWLDRCVQSSHAAHPNHESHKRARQLAEQVEGELAERTCQHPDTQCQPCLCERDRTNAALAEQEAELTRLREELGERDTKIETLEAIIAGTCGCVGAY